jgi:hypothetical protein
MSSPNSPAAIPKIIRPNPDQPQSVPQQATPPQATRSSASEGFSQNTTQFDSSQFNPQSRGRSNQLASRGSNNLNSAIEFQGDYFGVVPIGATATQVFQFDTPITSPYVGQSILLPDNQGTLDITAIADDGTLTLGNPQGLVTNQPDGFQFVSGFGSLDPNTGNYNIDYGLGTDIQLPTNLTGRLKFAENVGLIPRNRVFLNYNYFHNVPLATNGGAVGVNRFTPGFEKTFLDDLTSVEVRVPFSSTLTSDLFATGSNEQRVQFGNVFMSFKGLLWANDRWASTMGTSVSLPTEQDIRVSRRDGTELIQIKNESVHLLPFLGFTFFPSDRLFAQVLTQVDVDTNGRPVLANFGNGLENIGKFRDQTMMFNSAAVAYRLWNSGYRRSVIRSVIPTMEVHWNRSLDRSAELTNDFSTLDSSRNFESINLISGLTLDLINNSRLAVGYVAPVSRTDLRVFDGELRVMLNKYY